MKNKEMRENRLGYRRREINEGEIVKKEKETLYGVK